MQSGRIFSLAVLTFALLQNVCHRRRQVVFDRLLAAFGILRKKVADLERTKEVQGARIAELEGMLLPSSSIRYLPSGTFLF